MKSGTAFIIFGIENEGKAQLLLTISDNLNKEKDLHAGKLIRDLAKAVQGGGGGQAFLLLLEEKIPVALKKH